MKSLALLPLLASTLVSAAPPPDLQDPSQHSSSGPRIAATHEVTGFFFDRDQSNAESVSNVYFELNLENNHKITCQKDWPDVNARDEKSYPCSIPDYTFSLLESLNPETREPEFNLRVVYDDNDGSIYANGIMPLTCGKDPYEQSEILCKQSGSVTLSFIKCDGKCIN